MARLRQEDELLRLGQHRAPRARRRLDAEAEEAQRRLGQDEVAHAAGRGDDDHREDVGHDVAADDAPVRRADGAGRQDELALLHRVGLAAHQPADERPAQ